MGWWVLGVRCWFWALGPEVYSIPNPHLNPNPSIQTGVRLGLGLGLGLGMEGSPAQTPNTQHSPPPFTSSSAVRDSIETRGGLRHEPSLHPAGWNGARRLPAGDG